MTAAQIAERVLAGDARATARAISLIEDDGPAAADLIRRVFAHTGRAYLIGVTGAPGAGKSTLVDKMTSAIRQTGQTVGIVAVDPTSPFSGGAILGDRVRMQAHAGDHGVFIRSMATRGHLGGLAHATGEAALLLDASGRDVVLIETVGVGQDEVDIVRTADISLVTIVPGAGDDVQALKAGIMEIADIFVVNKADREGADRTVASIETMLSLQSYDAQAWRPPIIKTEAISGKGICGAPCGGRPVQGAYASGAGKPASRSSGVAGARIARAPFPGARRTAGAGAGRARGDSGADCQPAARSLHGGR